MRILYIKSTSSLLLFLIQYTSLAFLLLSGPLFPEKWYAWIFYLPGWVLGLRSIFSMGMGNLNAAPDVLPAGRFVSSGPYRIIRHPMYAAILLVFIPLVITKPSLLRFICLCILILNLLIKIRYEERRLGETFGQYAEYSDKTWRLIPYVF